MAEKSKYPWIPKEYYAAVMFACKMIRENGCCNKDVHIAADYYGVSEYRTKWYVLEIIRSGQEPKEQPEND